jgi:lipopolysaccharide biosynthesis glycosyltransferase
LNIAITFSPNWAKYVAVEMFALFVNNPAPIKVFLISDNLEENDLSVFDDICTMCGKGYTFEYINAYNLYNSTISGRYNVVSRFTKYTLYRLLIPKLIKEEKVLYIDADAICNSKITDFYNIDMTNICIIGVQDSGINDVYKKKYGLSKNDIYCNGGVLLMNLSKIKELGIDKEWIRLVNSRSFENNDQDIIMTSCRGYVRNVGIQYNTSLSTGLNIDKNQIKICHYAGIKNKELWVKKLPFFEIWDKWERIYNFRLNNVKKKIPKKIYYAWFGNNQKPEGIQRCINSWKKYCPDYKVIEINESNFDVTSHPYTLKAYIEKKYAFINDFCRLNYLYKYGGIYLDADVEILKPLDVFLKYDYVSGHETEEIPVCATMMSKKNHPYVKALLDYYENAPLNFSKPNTEFITNITKNWIVQQRNGVAFLKHGGVILPPVIFAPFDHKRLTATPTNESYTIHYFMGSWINRKKQTVVKREKIDYVFSNNEIIKVMNPHRYDYGIKTDKEINIGAGQTIKITGEHYKYLLENTDIFEKGYLVRF